MKLSLLVVLFALLSVSLVLGAPRPSAQRLRQRPQAVPASVVRPATNATAAFGTCWIGNINDCTGESRAWTEATPAARATPYIQSASLGTTSIGVPGLSQNVGFALNEVGACAGTCMAPNSASCASKKWQRGVCPGTTICCLKATAAPAAAAPAAAAPAAAAPAAAAAAPAGLTGSSPRVKDPTALVAGGRSIQWSDLTTEQQTNARLLVRYAKQQSITNVNQVAYILGTATWECHLKPIKEFGGPKKRYAPYYGRGFVQLTWRENYRTMTNLLKSQAGITADLVRTPDLALNPTNAAFIAAYGMKYGSFTTRKLDDYFTATASNWVGARAIINGSDKADIIAKLGRAWVPLVRLLMA